jgi:hypothetical protein
MNTVNLRITRDQASTILAVLFDRAERVKKPAGMLATDTDEWKLATELTAMVDAPQQTIVIPPLNRDLRAILGRICYTCVEIATILRANGVEIARRAEDEQAAVIHWLLTVYAEHGEAWAHEADKQLRVLAKRALEASKAAGAQP